MNKNNRISKPRDCKPGTLLTDQWRTEFLTFGSLFFLAIGVVGIGVSQAHDFPFEPGQEKVRKIYSAKNYQWKIESRTKLSGTYKYSNAYVSSKKVRNGQGSEALYSRNCIASFLLTAIDTSDSKVRTLGANYVIDGTGYFLVEVRELECNQENPDGWIVFNYKKGYANSANILTETEGNQSQHDRLSKQLRQFEKWTKENYVLYVRTSDSSHFYTFDGDQFDGNLAQDTGLFNGAFVNFAIPSGKGYKAGNWLQDISALQIPQPMFMQSDPVFGPNRVPSAVDEAPVTLKRLSGGMSEISSDQTYRWEDSLHNGRGFEAVRARFVFAPEPEFGFVHLSKWNAVISWQREFSEDESRMFERQMDQEFHLEVVQDDL